MRLFSAILLFSVALFPTQIWSDDRDERMLEESEAVLRKSRDFRQNFNSRSLASMTEEDQHWKKEYDDIMSDNSDTDWLELASDL